MTEGGMGWMGEWWESLTVLAVLNLRCVVDIYQ